MHYVWRYINPLLQKSLVSLHLLLIRIYSCTRYINNPKLSNNANGTQVIYHNPSAISIESIAAHLQATQLVLGIIRNSGEVLLVKSAEMGERADFTFWPAGNADVAAM